MRGTITPQPFTNVRQHPSWADSPQTTKQRPSDYRLGIFKRFTKYLTIGNGNASNVLYISQLHTIALTEG